MDLIVGASCNPYAFSLTQDGRQKIRSERGEQRGQGIKADSDYLDTFADHLLGTFCSISAWMTHITSHGQL